MLELKHISFSVNEEGKTVDILRDIDLTLDDRSFIVITGPNGSGKSTLARIIAGIERPTSGRILMDGVDITDKSITERARMGIAFAFQQPVRFKGLGVLDLLRIATGRSLTMDEACDYLFEVGLCAKDYIDREVNSSLSGGELKRIEIATVMARRAKLTLFDEPEAGIDLWSFQNLSRIFTRMREDIQDSTILVISHQERILSIADEIVVLSAGTIEKKGPAKDILEGILGTESAAPGCERLKQ